MFISVANLLRVFDRICQAHFYFTLENVDFGQKMLIRGSGGRGGRREGTEGDNGKRWGEGGEENLERQIEAIVFFFR